MILKYSQCYIHVNILEHQQPDNSLKICPNPASDYIQINTNLNKKSSKIIYMI